METHTTSDERLAAICQMIRNETLDPALKEAEHIKHLAEREAARIRAEAKHEAEKMLHEARQTIKEEKEAFEATLHQGAIQLLGVLKGQIEKDLFEPGVDQYLSSEFKDPVKVGNLIELLVEGLKKEGISGNLTLFLGQNLKSEEVSKHLLHETLEQLEGKTLRIGTFPSGLILKIQDRHMAIEITPESICEIIVPFLRPDFRRFLFNE